MNGRPAPSPPSLDEQKDQLLRHHARLVEQEGDPRGTVLMRKFACRYLSGVPGSREFRMAISQAQDAADFVDIVERAFPQSPAESVGALAHDLTEPECS